MLKNRLTETLLSSAAIIVACTFLFQLFIYSDRQLPDTYTVQARITDIGTLGIGSSVKLGGVTVGQIRSIAFDPQSHVTNLVLAINRSLRLPADSVMQAAKPSLLGRPYLDLTLGQDSGTIIPAGGRINRVIAEVNLLDSVARTIFGRLDQ